MRNWNIMWGSVLLCTILIGCATQQNPVAVTASERQSGVHMEAKSFEFRPNIIKVLPPVRKSLVLAGEEVPMVGRSRKPHPWIFFLCPCKLMTHLLLI
jgi:hypothetical protein